jgi:tRNA(Ile)-lysidine synthase
MASLIRLFRAFVDKHKLLRAGDRVGVAVSGGGDSVALLTAINEVKEEFGLVLSAVHFNHKLRGAESDGDEEFVVDLAARLRVPVHRSEADTRQLAREKELNLEAAARELRYSFFSKLITTGDLDKVATAHTLDDQAETVLLRILRGTGTSGLSGIHPRLLVGPKGTDWKGIIRPFLSTKRREVEEYLLQHDQGWRNDSTNSETAFTRNRLRHDVLPLLEREFNPEVTGALASLAEIARAEDDFWSAETAEAFIRVQRGGALDIPELLNLHPALQRRVLRLAGIQAGLSLDFPHLERILERLVAGRARVELPNQFVAVIEEKKVGFQSNVLQAKPCGYSYRLTIPGEAELAELGVGVRAVIVTGTNPTTDYNPDVRLAIDRLPKELVLRNWRAGDRFWPAHTSSAKKVKELLQERHLPPREKSLWPVALAGDEIVWMRGFPVAARYMARQGKAVVLEEFPLHAMRT